MAPLPSVSFWKDGPDVGVRPGAEVEVRPVEI